MVVRAPLDSYQQYLDLPRTPYQLGRVAHYAFDAVLCKPLHCSYACFLVLRRDSKVLTLLFQCRPFSLASSVRPASRTSSLHAFAALPLQMKGESPGTRQS